MGLIAQRSEGGAQIPPGEKLRFRINSAVEDWGEHGPQAELELEVLDGEHKGSTLLDWSKLAQPRLDFVKNLREKGYEEEKIVEILRRRGYEFDDIDEPEDGLLVADGGKLFNIALAAFNGNVKQIDSFESIDDLLGALVGRSFVSITKKRGKTGDCVGITWDQIYTDPEKDFDDIPI
jgi:hypothetical protein